MLKNSRKTDVVDQNLETATTKTDPKKASGRQVSRLAITTIVTITNMVIVPIIIVIRTTTRIHNNDHNNYNNGKTSWQL